MKCEHPIVVHKYRYQVALEKDLDLKVSISDSSLYAITKGIECIVFMAFRWVS